MATIIDRPNTVLLIRPDRTVIFRGTLGGSGSGVTDHGALSGLADDDHSQYALADGSRGDFEPTGTASAAVAAHVAAADPHSQYALEANLGTAAAANTGDFATAAQGVLADSATQPADLASAISTHAGATDPHGDRAYADAALATKLDDVAAGTDTEIVGANAAGTALQRLGYTIATLLAAARDRATHTGTQLASTISDFASAVGTLIATHAGLTTTHGVSGAIAGTSDAQTLTNKTISGASNTVSNLASASMPNGSIITESGITRTMADSDSGQFIRCTNAAGCTVTFPDSLTAGKGGQILQAVGAGSVEWAVSGSMVATPSGDSRSAHTASNGEGSYVTWFVDATNSVIIGGDTA